MYLTATPTAEPKYQFQISWPISLILMGIQDWNTNNQLKKEKKKKEKNTINSYVHYTHRKLIHAQKYIL